MRKEKERGGKRKKKKGAEKEGDGRTECKYRKNRNKNRGRRKWRKKGWEGWKRKAGRDERSPPCSFLYVGTYDSIQSFCLSLVALHMQST